MLSRRVKIKIERFKLWLNIFRITFIIMFTYVDYCLFAIYIEGYELVYMLTHKDYTG